MTNQEKQNALLKDIKKVLNDHGAEIQTRVLSNYEIDLLLCFDNHTHSIGDIITRKPIKDIEWYKEREEYLISEVAHKDMEIEKLKQSLSMMSFSIVKE